VVQAVRLGLLQEQALVALVAQLRSLLDLARLVLVGR
jgi:hypothetical protein